VCLTPQCPTAQIRVGLIAEADRPVPSAGQAPGRRTRHSGRRCSPAWAGCRRSPTLGPRRTLRQVPKPPSRPYISQAVAPLRRQGGRTPASGPRRPLCLAPRMSPRPYASQAVARPAPPTANATCATWVGGPMGNTLPTWVAVVRDF
jgi:hypothetical protein